MGFHQLFQFHNRLLQITLVTLVILATSCAQAVVSKTSQSSTTQPPFPSRYVGNSPVIARIQDIAQSSDCAQKPFRSVGLVPKSYTAGMAVHFAKSYCALQRNDYFAGVMSQPMATGKDAEETDSLAFLKDRYESIGIQLDKGGAEVLRATYILGVALGARESTGVYCEGYNKDAGSNRPSDEIEAGAFQLSFNVIKENPILRGLYQRNMASRSTICLGEIFSRNVSCDKINPIGGGAAAHFQLRQMTCPSEAADLAVTGVRLARTHFGTINRRRVDIKQSCDAMLQKVQEYVDDNAREVCSTIDPT